MVDTSHPLHVVPVEGVPTTVKCLGTLVYYSEEPSVSASSSTGSLSEGQSYIVERASGEWFIAAEGAAELELTKPSPEALIAPQVLSSNTSIDLNRGPFDAEAGRDITKALQAAIEAVYARGGGTVYFSRPGVYLLGGAPIEGEVEGYKYAGQLLFPARKLSVGRITIRLLGPQPPPRQWNAAPGEPPNESGVVILSTATSGNMFDIIPAEKFEATGPWTNICLVTENLTLRTPPNPAVGGIRGEGLIEAAFLNTHIGTNKSGFSLTYPTNTATALSLPGFGNGSRAIARGVDIAGFKTGLSHSENANLDQVIVQNCALGIAANGGGGEVTYRHVTLDSCTTMLEMGATFGTFTGDLEIVPGGGAWEMTMGVKDTNNAMSGALQIFQAGTPARGWPVLGAQGSANTAIGFASSYRGGVFSTNCYPIDTFLRSVYPANMIGVTDQTHHPWVIAEGECIVEAGKGLRSNKGAATSLALCPYFLRHSTGTRTVKTTLTTGVSTYNVQQILGRTYKNANTFLNIKLAGGKATIQKVINGATTVLAESEAGKVAEKTKYEWVTTIANLRGSAKYTVVCYLNGTEVVKFEGEIAELADNVGEIRKQDGLRWVNETTSFIEAFSVIPSIA